MIIDSLDTVALEHSFYDCLINIEHCYHKKQPNPEVDNEWIHYTSELQLIFSKMPDCRKNHYLAEAKDRLKDMKGGPDLIGLLEGVLKGKNNKV